jgi:DNA-binding transcriptional ArsR family regulator
MKRDHPIDADIVKALAHPLRVRILNVLDQRTASPKQIADELQVSLGTVSYHVRTLAGLGLIRLVSRRQRRGATEHFYRAEVRPVISDENWAQVPGIVKEAMIGANLATTGEYVQAAAAAGGFSRDDIHLSRTTMELDERAWRTLSRELAKTFERVRRLADATAERLTRVDPHPDTTTTTVVLMMFEGGEPAQPTGRPSRRRARASGRA